MKQKRIFSYQNIIFLKTYNLLNIMENKNLQILRFKKLSSASIGQTVAYRSVNGAFDLGEDVNYSIGDVESYDVENDLYTVNGLSLAVSEIFETQEAKPNTYQKYTANVYVAKCAEMHEKGETILVQTKYGKENECIVFNLVGRDRESNFFYSIVRADGYNVQERAKAKAERYQRWAAGAEKKSTEYYEASQEGKDFLSLGEPIKVGHHSEKRHRALIDRNWERMGKSVAMTDKAEQHESKAEYWERKANDVNLSMPESVEYYEYKVEEVKEKHEGLLSGKYERSHSYSLTYAKKAVNEAEKNLATAKKLWE